ncbi:hypothetical protein HRD49_04220 [Corallococcus exiguus]|uniref:hypothetical protein n=1 Tax=Corallococcus exiguus TaxID=83462 RepID=UPI0015609811|nr:hypothetical protein [Corallococcus exiguus]NRD52222.1 hypothetical protein [Corallococcus exiguus]NRD60947.1 hypothetical protein [Corallococcus exiguus]
MSTSNLPIEVELIYELMPCNAMRSAQEPLRPPHPCAYFRQWGSYHSYDYVEDSPPPEPGIVHPAKYVGRAPLVPEALSGCRKAPIMAVGINPNLPAWWSAKRQSLYPLFDDYQQYAHYFRYRAVDKLEVPRADYERFGGGAQDTPYSDFELQVPADETGARRVPLKLQPQKMYETYQGLLDSVAEEMGWRGHKLRVGEDLSYGNMVACPSAKWTTRASPEDPTLPPMTVAQRDGIVSECFRERRYFLRQLFQSLPSVLLCFSQSTANALISELKSLFVKGNPQPGEPLESLMSREIRLTFGAAPDGSELGARVIFAPHITGDSDDFEKSRARVIEQLLEEARAGRLAMNSQTGHLRRPKGACVLCTLMRIGPCDYERELQPLSPQPALTAASPGPLLAREKSAQLAWVRDTLAVSPPVPVAWGDTDEEAGERFDSGDLP